MPLSDMPDSELLARAVRGARSRRVRLGEKHHRWVAVTDLFALGSTYARELCLRYAFDPDEIVTRE